MAMFISLRSKKQKMVAGSGFGESTLEELTGILRCLTGGTREDLAGGS